MPAERDSSSFTEVAVKFELFQRERANVFDKFRFVRGSDEIFGVEEAGGRMESSG
jgi:hypothetical protein